MPRGPRGPIEKPKDRKRSCCACGPTSTPTSGWPWGRCSSRWPATCWALLGPMLSGAAIDAIGIEPGQADFPTGGSSTAG